MIIAAPLHYEMRATLLPDKTSIRQKGLLDINLRNGDQRSKKY